MAKKRILKKNINCIASELFTDALLCNLFLKEVNKDKMESLMSRIIEMEETFIRRAHHPDAKENKALVKKYYNKLLADLQEETNAIGKELETLSKGAE